MRTNLERALNGRDMAASALGPQERLGLEDYEDALTDALTNLMHFARRYEIDFELQLDRARNHHQAERQYAWDAVPD